MAAGNWIMYDSAKKLIGDGTIDLDSHTFKVMLTTNAYTPDRDTHTVKADVTNELATASGYTAGGQALASVTLTETAGSVAWDAADPAWTASGTLTFRKAVIYDDTSASDSLVAYCILDTVDIVVTSGQTFTLALNAAGILTLSGASS